MLVTSSRVTPRGGRRHIEEQYNARQCCHSHASIIQAQSHTHLNKTRKRQRAIHVDRNTHAQSHTCVNTALTQAESHAPIVQAQSHTHLNKTLKRQRAIHMDRYTHAQSHTHLNKTLKRQRAIHMDRYTHAQSHRIQN